MKCEVARPVPVDLGQTQWTMRLEPALTLGGGPPINSQRRGFPPGHIHQLLYRAASSRGPKSAALQII